MHILNNAERNVTNNVNGTTHTDELTVQHWAHCTPFVDVSSNLFTLSHWLKASSASRHFHLIHGHAHWCLISLLPCSLLLPARLHLPPLPASRHDEQ